MNTEEEKLVKETANALGNPTLPQLVDVLVKNKGLKSKDATKAVYVLWKKGEIDVSEPTPASNLPAFAFNVESLWFWASTTLVAATLAVVFLVDSYPMLYARYALGGLFILFLPGAMFVLALYPRNGEIDGLERLALSIGLSLAIVPLVGLLLNYTPWGIRLAPIMVALAIFAEVMAFVALVRKYRYYKLSLK